MHVVVCGAGGATGRHLVDQARSRGWEVTSVDAHAVDPHPDAVDDAATGAAPVTGARDPGVVAGAARDATAVLSVVGERIDAGTTLYSDCARAFVQALSGARCRLVFCTGAGVGERPPPDPWIRDHIAEPVRHYPGHADMARAEELLRGSDLDWVVVRPGRLHDRPALGAVEATEGFRPELGTSLARADLARFMLDQVVRDDWVRRTATLGSPWD